MDPEIYIIHSTDRRIPLYNHTKQQFLIVIFICVYTHHSQTFSNRNIILSYKHLCIPVTHSIYISIKIISIVIPKTVHYVRNYAPVVHNKF